MLKLLQVLRKAMFVVAILTGMAIMYPVSIARTFAAEPGVRRVTVVADGKTTQHRTTTTDVTTFLEEEGFVVNPGDEITGVRRDRVEDRSVIHIERGFYADVRVDGVSEIFRVTQGTTVEDKLQVVQPRVEAALIFHGDLSAEIQEGYPVNFYTWRSEFEMTIEVLPFEVEIITTPSLSYGEERVRQEGASGERRTEETVIFIGNVEYSRERTGEFITLPVSRIIDRGIGGDLGTLTDTNSPSFHYVRRVTMNASAYTSGFSCTGKRPGDPWYGITASGRRVEHGIVAVDRNVIPLGTRLYVDGYGFAIAADVGSAIRGYMIDLFMYCIYEARQFGRREITVWILE